MFAALASLEAVPSRVLQSLEAFQHLHSRINVRLGPIAVVAA
jgi:hypothetical protein